MTISLSNVGSGFKRTALNANFEAIEAELNDNVLRRDGVTGANQLEVDIDVNSQRLLNLVDAITGSEPATLNQLQSAINIGHDGLIVSQREVQYGDNTVGSLTTLSGITYTVDVGNLYVYRNGVFQTKGVDYQETSSSTVTWIAPIHDEDTLTFITNITTTNSVTTTDAISHSDGGVSVNLKDYLNSLITAFVIERQLGSAAVSKVFTLTTFLYDTDGLHLEVFRNGLLLDITEDYLETTTSSITLVNTPNATDRFKFRVLTAL